MDEWLKQLGNNLYEVAAESSKWLGQASQEGEALIERWVDSSVVVIQEAEKSIEDNVAPVFLRLNDRVSDSLDTALMFVDEKVTPWVEQAAAPIVNTVNPLVQDHPTCVGCRNYHGADYGNEMLVCGMHPYGPDDESCADWESVWPVWENEN